MSKYVQRVQAASQPAWLLLDLCYIAMNTENPSEQQADKENKKHEQQ